MPFPTRLSRSSSFFLSLGLLLVGAVVPVYALAEDTPENAAKSASAHTEPLRIQPPYHVVPLRFGMLLTTQLDVGPDQANGKDTGFRTTDARVLVAGRLEQGFGYLLQAELVRSRPLLDSIVDWTHESGSKISVGFFRTPSAGELAIPAPRLDFIDRSQIVRTLSTDRQVGLQVDQPILGDALVARAGLFGGDGLSSGDDERFVYLLRLDGRARMDDGTLFEYGAVGGYTKDEDAIPGFNGLAGTARPNHSIAGADFRVTRGNLFFSTEAMVGFLDADLFPNSTIWGYQASVGWRLSRRVQVLARYDALHAERVVEDTDLAIASLVLNFTDYLNLQAELRVPTRGTGPEPGGAVNLNLQF